MALFRLLTISGRSDSWQKESEQKRTWGTEGTGKGEGLEGRKGMMENTQKISSLLRPWTFLHFEIKHWNLWILVHCSKLMISLLTAASLSAEVCVFVCDRYSVLNIIRKPRLVITTSTLARRAYEFLCWIDRNNFILLCLSVNDGPYKLS